MLFAVYVTTVSLLTNGIAINAGQHAATQNQARGANFMECAVMRKRLEASHDTIANNKKSNTAKQKSNKN